MRHVFRRSAALVAASLVPVAVFAQTAAENHSDAERLRHDLHLAAGATVCEIGAGSGELTVLMAEAVGPSGRVVSNELNAERRAEISKAAAGAGVSNVTVVEGAADSANIAPGTCDALFMRNVYHHFGAPEAMNATLFQALKPGGRIAVIDFTPRGTESADPKGRADEAHHGVSSASVMRELQSAGFTDVGASELQPGVFIVVGGRPSR